MTAERLIQETGLTAKTVRSFLRPGDTKPRRETEAAIESVLWPDQPGEIERLKASDDEPRTADDWIASLYYVPPAVRAKLRPIVLAALQALENGGNVPPE
jgi:hypothetical protein